VSLDAQMPGKMKQHKRIFGWMVGFAVKLKRASQQVRNKLRLMIDYFSGILVNCELGVALFHVSIRMCAH
jgi:hypothetical protein